ARSVFDRLVEHVGAHHPNVWLGVGSIVEATTAAAYSAAGAAFVVGPTTEDGVAATCRDVGVPYVPGAATPTEIRRAVSVGNGLIKIFPADAVGGPGFVAAILGPMPGLRLMPTGGVGTSEVELRRWFDAGVTCVGLGGALISQDVLAASDWSALAAHTASVAKTIESIRRP
ncbi:MAG: bifunctional 4-hydroxy-2-oxoglutarate aldolase/2-dehydro-3-deoxy-phosphogluconate aldolase, partial [Acidimicrobiia bacterium]|nr:bifunctional 4-hydroxy-2-oxoglutarate aldolase/2-dehydro-3-deoxy-phosphogluconate aldolase [Acidimicrobiia bacterium]